MKNKLAVFFIGVFISNLFIARSFAVPAGYKVIEEIEAEEEKKQLPTLRPLTKYTGAKLRDPFQGVKIEREEKVQEATGPATPPPALTVQGLVWGGAFPQAIINNKVFKVGDTIEEARIIDINKDGVTIFFGGRQYNIEAPAAVSRKLPGGKDEK
ncbi:MAG: hypothetical protein WC321_05610 [Candidatus Omnitrophota bacterium]|jgi:hypothetical protein